MKLARSIHCLVFVLSAALAFAPASVVAAEPSARDQARTEAHERFDRGLRLFNQGHNSGALAEFQRAYELVPHPLVLYNIGLVHAAMGEPVEAVEAFDRLLNNPGELDTERVAKARRKREEMAARIGEIVITANVEGAAVEVDNVEVTRTPLDGPLRVASGEHIVGVVAPRFLPARRKITVAGQSRVETSFQLQPLEGQLANIRIETNVPDVNVYADGELVGRTPLPASLALAPGNHTLKLEREGYSTETRQLTLGEGSTGELSVELQLDERFVARNGAVLALDVSEPDPVIFVDGEPAGGETMLRLPPGRHRLRVERADFFPFERTVSVEAGDRVSIPVELEPTADKRAAYRASEQRKRTAAWVTTGTGVALIGGSLGFLIWNQGEKDEANQRFDEFEAISSPGSGGRCDTTMQVDSLEACETEKRIVLEKIDEANARDKWGIIGIGVGAASVAAGVVLFVIGEDPDKYEPQEESDVFAARHGATPSAWVNAEGGGMSIRGYF